MKDNKLKLEDFGIEKLSNNQQKIVKGGDGEGTIDPNKEKGTGNLP
ncbi:hypothetical protein EV143_10165 [Flavobacterium chryseum]|nr:rSAM-modified peptide [Flavobacterium sp. P3160]TDO83629.1 hypothetical protein EV143_10165 [Flavobacterium sp. P3160]